MADNLIQLQEDVETFIDPNGLAGSILAENHQNILKGVLNKVGKYVGSPYLATKNEASLVPGVMSWNGNAMNNTNVFEIQFASLTADLNDFGLILGTLTEGDLIRFKDSVGRSVFLEFVSYQKIFVASLEICKVNVKGRAENINYIYQDDERLICVIETYKQNSAGAIYEIQFNAPNFVLLENGVPKTSIDLSIAITDTIQATETSLADFATNSANYTFQQGDVISIVTNPDNILELYLYKSGTKTDVNNYQKIDASKIDWSNILNKPDNLTNIEIQDENGIVKFNVNELIQFENVVFDSANKRIVIPKSQDIELISSSVGTSNMHGCYLRECGSVFFALRTSGDCDKYVLSRPFDLTTKTLVQSVEIGNGVGTGLDFKPDGSVVYYSEDGTDDYYQRQLTTPWDLTTVQPIETYSQPAGQVLSIKWNIDGTKFYTRSRTGLRQGLEIHNVSTPWDLTTVTSTQDLTDILTSKFDDFDFGKDGYLLYTVDRNSGFRFYSMANPYDLSTLSYHGEVPSNINFLGIGATLKSKYIGMTKGADIRIYINNIY